MKSGIGSFIQAHPTTSYLYDIKHKAAALLKQYLQQDEIWKQFTQLATQTESQVQQTAIRSNTKEMQVKVKKPRL